ncbi:MAG: OmpA family protein [bacterium]
MKKLSLFAVMLIPLSGCVTASKFKAQETQLVSVRSELEEAKKENASVSERADKRTHDLAACTDQLADSRKSNKDLQESLEANRGELSKKVSELIKERDGLNQKISDTAKQTNELIKTKEGELARALADKKALEEAKEAELAMIKKNYEDLTAGLKAEISAGEITITNLKGRLTVNMVDKILFESGMAEVRTAGKKILDNVGKVLTGIADKDIKIEGHTDNVPIGGDLKNRYPTNWELSTARATAVARYLQDNARIDPKRLMVAGFGEYRPVAANDTPENKALNRRIEIVLVAKE